MNAKNTRVGFVF